MFRVYLREFSILLHEIYMVANYYQVLAADIKSLLISALINLETRLIFLILAIFWWFVAFFKLSDLAQAFDLEEWFFTKIYSNLCTLTSNKSIFLLQQPSRQKLILRRPAFEKSRKIHTPGLALIKCRFQFYSSEKLKTWSVSRYWWNNITQ